MNAKKTFPTVALVAILMISLTPTSAFAMSADEERAQGALNDYDPFAKRTFSPTQFTTTQIDVGTELSLLVDSSGSINSTEFDTQRMGYAAAFKSDAVKNLVEFGCPGQDPLGIAVNLVYWSNSGEQVEAVGWEHLDSAADSEAFGDLINNTARPFTDLTAIGNATKFAVPLFTGNGFNSPTQVIDVSGDGITNDPGTPASGLDNTPTERDNALAAGIDRINGLVISPQDTPGLLAYYQANVTGGTGSFVLTVPDLQNLDVFTDAVIDKILLEICPVGGESLSISTASLMVAGIYANAIWILPALAGVAGAGAYVIRSRMNKD